MPDNLMSSPFLYNLSLTLIHFVWQGFFVALALKIALSFTSYKKPQWRYAFSSLAMVANLLLPLFTFFIIYQPDFQQFSPLLTNSMLLGNVINDDTQNTAIWYANIIELLPYLSITWITISFILAIKLFIELYNVNQLPKTGTSSADPALEARFHQLVEQVKLKCTPQILISLKNDIPMAIGWIKPVVLIPVTMLSGLTPSQLDMLILHELAHIRRHDYLVNFIQTLVEILLFFHPGVRWVSKQMRNEREYCSDDIAVQHSGNPVAYAHTLADTASICNSHRHHSIPAMAMAASGGDLKQRVLRLIDQNQHCSTTNNSGKWLASVAIIFSIIAVGSQKYIQIPTLDLNSDNMLLYRGSDDTFTNNENSNRGDTKALPSLAQQLLHQENVSAPIVNKLPEDISLAAQKDIFNNIGGVSFDQEASNVASKNIPFPNNNAAEIKDAVKSIDNLFAKKIDKKLVPTKNIITNTVINFPNNTATENSKVSLSKSQNTVDESFQELTLTKKSGKNKSMSELAFDRTDSKINGSRLNNPYAEQVANLAMPPLPIYGQLDLPSRKRSNNIEQSLLSTGDLSTNLMPVSIPAQLLTSVYPKYPTTAKRKRIETDIEVTFTIDTKGYIRDIQYDGKGRVNYFRNTIRSSLEQWRFKPASFNNQPIESTMSKIFSFSIAK
jgi:beta-lactamase regulating signal transducer with metallopeptidase domain/outer membrane biosynthesis protein TonB